MKHPVMQYADARELIQCGDQLGFSHGNVGGVVIKAFTWSKYTHVAVVAPERYGRVQVFEAVLSGVREEPLSNLGDFYWIPLHNPLNEEAIRFAMSQKGNKYSMRDCVKGYLGFASARNLQWQCAELSKKLHVLNGKEGLSRVMTPHRTMDEMCPKGFIPILVKN
jgi:hypothetical protein